MENMVKKLLLVGVLIASVFISGNTSFSASEVTKSTIGATIGDTFPDEGLASCVASSLGKNTTDSVSPTELDGITGLTCYGVDNIEGIDLLPNISKLTLGHGNIEDIDLLAELTNLTNLYLSFNQINDISALSGLTSLTNLSLFSNQINDISELSGLTSLTALNLSGNQINDISVVSGLTSLTNLDLSSNQINDISALSGLTNLRSLDLSSNPINDISALSGLTSLTYLDLTSNQINDIRALSGLTSLTNLYLGSNQINDISELSGLTNLMYLDLSSNQINDISELSGLTNLAFLKLDNQTIDLGVLLMSNTKIPAPISVPLMKLDGTSLTTGTIEYKFFNGETIDGNEININENMGTPIDFEDGIYSGTIKFTRTNEKPIINQPGDTTITEGDKLDVLDKVTATDVEDGDLTSAITVSNPDNFKGDGKDAVGTYTITYTVLDSDGNTVSVKRTITVVAKEVVDPIDGGGTDSGNTDNTNAGNTDDTNAGNANDTNAENIKAMTIAKTGLNTHIQVVIIAAVVISVVLVIKNELNKRMN